MGTKKLFFLFLFCLNAWGQVYKCVYNSAPPGKNLLPEETALFYREIEFDTSLKTGKELVVNPIKIFLWRKENAIYLRYQDSQRGLTFTTYYPVFENFLIEVEPHIQFKCSLPGPPGKKAKKIVKTIDPNADLSNYPENTTLDILTDLKFFYYQQNANDRMRSIVFENGQLYSLDSDRDKTQDWCIFTIEVKLDEDTFISKGTKIRINSFNLLSNNPEKKVYAFNFVDIAAGKKLSETTRYAPFALECRISKNKILTLNYLKQITGNRLLITSGE
jgi:hypothetical protein